MTTAVRTRLYPPSAPRPRDLPAALGKAVLFGVLSGPPLALFFGIVSGNLDFSHPVRWLLRASGIGVTYSLAFYTLCGLPAGYVAKRLRGRARILVAAVAFAGGVIASIVALAILNGGTIGPRIWRIAFADGVFAIALSVIIGEWHRMRIERELADARARAHALQAQINPHFFFNTLNTISSLIPSDPDQAQRTVECLGAMSRYAFSHTETETVPLASEIEFARSYLEIERARFGSRVRYVLPDVASAGDIYVPPMILQPLVENAVRHGIARRPDGGAIRVLVQRSNGRFSLIVENDVAEGTPIAASGFFRDGHALANTRDRLRLTYRGAASIDVSSPSDGVVRVTVAAPISPA